jgi:hypothetical protein
VAIANDLNITLFYDHFNNRNTVDLQQTGNTGYNWRLLQAWPNPAFTTGNWSNIDSAPGFSASAIGIAGGAINLCCSAPFTGAGSTAGLGIQTAQANWFILLWHGLRAAVLFAVDDAVHSEWRCG